MKRKLRNLAGAGIVFVGMLMTAGTAYADPPGSWCYDGEIWIEFDGAGYVFWRCENMQWYYSGPCYPQNGCQIP